MSFVIPEDVVVAATAAVGDDEFLLEVLGSDFEIVGRPTPVTEGIEYIVGVQFVLRTPTPVALPPGMPTWKGRGEGDPGPVQPMLTEQASAPSTYFSVFLRTDYSVQFLNPFPEEFGERWAASTTVGAPPTDPP